MQKPRPHGKPLSFEYGLWAQKPQNVGPSSLRVRVWGRRASPPVDFYAAEVSLNRGGLPLTSEVLQGIGVDVRTEVSELKALNPNP